MERQRVLGGLALAVAAVVTVGLTYPETAAEHQVLLEAAPLAQLEGEALSPDGRYELQQIDRGGDGEAVPSMETVQLVDTSTGEVLWEESGDYETSALWSPEGTYVALSQRQRACGSVTVVETETFISWQVPLPEDVTSAEYAWISAEEWVDSDTLRIRYRDTREGGEGAVYCCLLAMEERGTLSGSVLKETAEILSEGYDFDHDGTPETTELVTVEAPDGDAGPAWYELRITRQDGTELWSAAAHWSHPGWTSVFACEIDGQDCLLQYEPEMWQGWGEYTYRLFHISPAGNEPAEQVLRESSVTWDLNFGRDGHHLNAAALADFLEEVHGYLDQSTLLLSTEDGEFRTGGSGAAFRLDMDLWDAFCPYDDTRSLQENLENLERFWTAARQAAETA